MGFHSEPTERTVAQAACYFTMKMQDKMFKETYKEWQQRTRTARLLRKITVYAAYVLLFYALLTLLP